MKTVLYYTMGDMLPTNIGNKKAMFEYFRYLAEQREFKMMLCIIGDVSAEHRKLYENMGAEVHVIPMAPRWCVWEILNKIGSRMGLDPLRVFFASFSYRKQFAAICARADVVLMTYMTWFNLLPLQVLRDKVIVITHDLLFYRRASIRGLDSWWKRFCVSVNRKMEIAILRRFRKVAVLADYEKRLLVGNGFDERRIITVGMPLQLPMTRRQWVPFEQRKYDFFLISSSGNENLLLVKKFVEDVLPLLKGRKVSFALVGRICESVDGVKFPSDVELIRLGVVDDPEEVFLQARIGVGTMTQGSGIKVKVVEMAMHGLPIVVTDKGIEGIPVTEEGIVNIDHMTSNEIKNSLLDWLDEPHHAEEAGRKLGTKVCSEFSPQKVLAELKNNILSI